MVWYLHIKYKEWMTMTTTSKDFYEADEVEGVLGRLLTVQVEKRQVYGVDK